MKTIEKFYIYPVVIEDGFRSDYKFVISETPREDTSLEDYKSLRMAYIIGDYLHCAEVFVKHGTSASDVNTYAYMQSDKFKTEIIGIDCKKTTRYESRGAGRWSDDGFQSGKTVTVRRTLLVHTELGDFTVIQTTTE